MINFEKLCYKSKIRDFDIIKPKILDAIESMGKFSVCDYAQKLSNTDWHLNETWERTYVHLIENEMHRHNSELCDVFKYNETYITNCWFQQYEMGDWHELHNHPNVSFSNVMFIELPVGSATKFWIRDEEYAVDVSEGEILSFPGLFLHKSPVITENKRKTVIVYNTQTTFNSKFKKTA